MKHKIQLLFTCLIRLFGLSDSYSGDIFFLPPGKITLNFVDSFMKIPDKYLNKLDIVYQYYALSFMLAVEISDWLDFI